MVYMASSSTKYKQNNDKVTINKVKNKRSNRRIAANNSSVI